MLNEVNEANSRLGSVPGEVHGFVGYLKFLHRALEGREAINERFEELQNHYQLMEEEKVQHTTWGQHTCSTHVHACVTCM